MAHVYAPVKPLDYQADGVKSFVVIGRDLDAALTDFIKSLSPFRIAIVSDTTVAELHGPKLRKVFDTVGWSSKVRWYSVKPGESSKTLATANEVLEEILPHMTRDSLIIAFGGGVVGNLTGTVASLLFRGSRFIHIPTTFMAQADSAIGIKQAVNATVAKNAFGAYHTPLAVFNDVRYLDTLPDSQWRNGLAESIKVAIARDPEFADELAMVLPNVPNFSDPDRYNLLEKTIYPKLSGLAEDPHERNTLLYLEIGHTLGHAIERASGGAVPHGQGISLGMLLETELAIRLKISTSQVYERLAELIHLAGLPTVLPHDVSTERIIHSLLHDNRRVSTGPLFVFADQLGHTRTESGIDINLVRSVLNDARA
jgi:3-dehydroquinate synthetase